MFWDSAEERTVELLSNLISRQSVNPDLDPNGTGEAVVAAYLRARLDDLGFETDWQEWSPGRPNVIGRLRGTGQRRVVLNGHTDTVSAQDMTVPPFEPRREGDWVYGRGACDMKGGLVAIVLAAEALSQATEPLAGDLVIAFTSDEEYAAQGMEHLVHHQWVAGATAGIVCEPTQLEVQPAHRGFGWYRIATTGKAAHGSQYDVGVDAIMHMGRVLAKLEALEREFGNGPAHPLLGRTSLHASLIQGGLELSSYPAHCRLDIEWRSLPSEGPGEARSRLQNILDDLAAADPNFSATLETLLERGAWELPQDAPVVQSLASASRQELGRIPELIGGLGWPEAELLNRAGIPTAMFGPSGDGAHAAIERVSVRSIIDCARVVAVATATLLQSKE